jgi:hypothetical protein
MIQLNGANKVALSTRLWKSWKVKSENRDKEHAATGDAHAQCSAAAIAMFPQKA